jgi:hypothetical protein
MFFFIKKIYYIYIYITMGGGLMQLVAYGAQDIYLTGNPQITFFKVVYRRHTNFSMECIRQNFNGKLPIDSTERADLSATISRNGDLIQGMYLKFALKWNSGSQFSNDDDNGNNFLSNDIGHALIDQVDLEIGGQLIDRQDGRWMQTYRNLTERNQWGCPYGITKFQKLSGTGSNTRFIRESVTAQDRNRSTSTQPDEMYYVPLAFWFCRNPGCALPLIALQYHEVKLKLQINALGALSASSAGFLAFEQYSKPLELWVDYIYLDTDERRRFAQVSHEYLIEQVQQRTYFVKNSPGTEPGIVQAAVVQPQQNFDLNFNHPVKELIWGYFNSTLLPESFPFLSPDCQAFAGPQDSLKNKDEELQLQNKPMDRTTYQLKLNGQDRFMERTSDFFNTWQIWKHHTGYGGIFPGNNSINVYSFALKPEEHQPSGTCNFSRIDSAMLEVSAGMKLTNGGQAQRSHLDSLDSGETTNVNLVVYAVNYNVLRIMSGMGGLAYSN